MLVLYIITKYIPPLTPKRKAANPLAIEIAAYRSVLDLRLRSGVINGRRLYRGS